MIHQAHSNLDYPPELSYAYPVQHRPSYNHSTKSRPALYDAPSRNQQINLQPQLYYFRNYQTPNLAINQPMTPFNMYSNRPSSQPSINPNYSNFPSLNIQTGASYENASTNEIYPEKPSSPAIQLTYATSHITEKDNSNYNENNKNPNKTFILKYKSKKSFPNKFKNFFNLEKYLKKHKPNVEIQIAFIDSNDELVIKLTKTEDLDELKTWLSNAFGHGIEQIIKESRFYLALHNVNTEFDVSSDEAKKYVKDIYGIDDMLRMMKKSTKSKLPLVKALVKNAESYKKLLNEGYIKLGYTRIRLSSWRFGTTPDQCFNCQQLGHLKDKFPEKTLTCLRCNKKHDFSKCKVTNPAEFQCRNCEGNHAACSKSCPKIQEAVNEKNKKLLSNSIPKSLPNRVNPNFTSYASIANHSTQQTINNLLLLIIQLMKDITQTTSAVNENPQHILNVISSTLGSSYSRFIATTLFQISQQNQTNNVTDNEMRNPYIANINEQQ
ncbi:reverse transcriptase [Brachionus plicatilis]|uniref:Reverse transcriptase n=1 Tax=Brachionus plicatilis TaxID=10195 RepID=A0A3M7PJS3_BRAPC|nr:reverse transcriptase [Brachionus plicatilis]